MNDRTEDFPIDAEVVESPTVDREPPHWLATSVESRRVRRGLAASLAIHLAAVALGVALASNAQIRVTAFGSARPLSLAAEFGEIANPADEPDETGPHEIVVMPTEAWQFDRHFINTTSPPAVGRSAQRPLPTAPRPSLDATAARRRHEAPPAENVRRKSPAPRRRAVAAVEPSVVPIALPPPDVRFVGRPCRYPAAAQEAGWEGEVKLLIAFDGHGAITKVDVKKSSGHPVLDAEAVQTARTWRAVPDKPGGRLWPGEVIKPIVFRLR